MSESTRSTAAHTLTAIHLALGGGVFLFAAIVLFVLQPLEPAVDSTVMRVVWLGLAAVAMLGAGVIRGRLAGAAGSGRARMAAILVWSLAETQAVVGIVGTMITGDRVLSYASLAIFVWIWLRYPPRSFLDGMGVR